MAHLKGNAETNIFGKVTRGRFRQILEFFDDFRKKKLAKYSKISKKI